MFIKAGLNYLVSLEPGGKTGPWPAGAGIVENTSLGNLAVDVSSETVQALGVLHEMAVAMGDHSTAAWAARNQKAMLKAFHQWWISSQNLYADSMCEGTQGDCTHAGQQLQQRWWATVAPMEQGVAPAGYYDLVIGLHPDNALREVVNSALIRPVVVVPCCNFRSETTKLGRDRLLDAIEKHHAAYGTSERVILDFRGPHNRALVLLPGLH